MKYTYFIWTFFGIIAIMAISTALTVINDKGISSGGDMIIPTNSSLWIYSDSAGYAEDPQAIYLVNQNPYSKAFIQWIDNSSGLNQEVGWIGCHNYSQGSYLYHNHCSIETWDSDVGFLETKLQISYGTFRNQSHVTVGNVADFQLAGANLRIWGADIINNDTTFNICTNGQTSNCLRFREDTNSVQLEAFGSDKINVTSNLYANKQLYVTRNVTIFELKGSGNAFACIDSDGKLYRSATVCVS